MKASNLFLKLLPYLNPETPTSDFTYYMTKHGYVLFYGDNKVTEIVLEHQARREGNNRLSLHLCDAETISCLFNYEFNGNVTVHEISKPIAGVIDDVEVRDLRPRVDAGSQDYAIFPLVAISKDDLTRIATECNPGQIISLTVKTAMPNLYVEELNNYR